MKTYTSSVFYRDGNNCVLPIPAYLCDAIALRDGEFFANLFIHHTVVVPNQIEMVISPFRRHEFPLIHNMRMRMKNASGSAHQMLSLIQDPDVFGMNVQVINGIDCACPDSGEVEVLAKITHPHLPVPQMLLGPLIQHFAINRKTGEMAEDLLNRFPPIPWANVSNNKRTGVITIRDIKPPEYASFYLRVEKCFDPNDYPPNGPFPACGCLDLPVRVTHSRSDHYRLLTISCADIGCTPLHCLNHAFGLHGDGAPSDSYTFATVRLDPERNALAVLMKSPVEKLYNFQLTFPRQGTIESITNLLSEELRLDFRSISSVRSPDEFVTVDIAANVTGSRVQGLSTRVMEHYLWIQNESRKLLLDPIEINKVLATLNSANGAAAADDAPIPEFPSTEEEQRSFAVHCFLIAAPVDGTDEVVRHVPFVQKPIGEQHDLFVLPESSPFFDGLFASCVEACETAKREKASPTAQELETVLAKHLPQDGPAFDAANCQGQADHIYFTITDATDSQWYCLVRGGSFLVIAYSGSFSAMEAPWTPESLCLEMGTRFRASNLADQAVCNELYRELLSCLVERKAMPVRAIPGMPKYELHEELGSGHFGTVFRAFDKEAAEWRALKITKTRLTHTEYKLAWKANHPNLIRYLEFEERSDDRHVIVMELVAGRTLEGVLEETSGSAGLDPNEVHELVSQILDGLACLHEEHQILHLDLKPDNIMCSDGGGVKILDFGLASKSQASQFNLTVSRRDIWYLAPELYRGQADLLEPRTDLFAVAIVAYRLMFIRPPYARYPDYLMGMMGEAPALDLSVFSAPRMRKYVPFFEKAASLDPKNRFYSAMEMKSAFEELR